MEYATQPTLPEYRLTGEIAQAVTVELKPGQDLWSAAGALMSYTETITWSLGLPGGAGAAVRRMLAGERVTLTHCRATNGEGHVVLVPAAPGKIAVWDLNEGPVVATRGAFIGAIGDIEINVTIARRPGTWFFGGAGLILQKISGNGLAFIHGAGDFLDYRLQERQTILVSTGNLAAFSSNVDYNIRGVGGCGKMLLGGEGIFMTSLTGPGRVLLQTLKRSYASAASAAMKS